MDSADLQATIIAIAGVVFVACPIAIAIARVILRRGSSRSASDEVSERLDRLEGSVDVIAIEVERVAENVRYLTKVLDDPRVRQGRLADGETANKRG